MRFILHTYKHSYIHTNIRMTNYCLKELVARGSELHTFVRTIRMAISEEERVMNVDKWEGSGEREITNSEKKWQAMSKEVRSYARVEYAGNEFRTEDSQRTNKHDNAVLREDYYVAIRFHLCAHNIHTIIRSSYMQTNIHRSRRILKRAYGRIQPSSYTTCGQRGHQELWQGWIGTRTKEFVP